MPLDLRAVHDWIYIDDFVQAMFNGYTEIGTGVQTSNADIVSALEVISGKKLNSVPFPGRAYDTDKWKCPVVCPHMPLFNGLKLTYEKYMALGWAIQNTVAGCINSYSIT